MLMGFKSTITCALLSLVHNDPQNQLWLPRPGPGPIFTHWYGEATAIVFHSFKF